MGLFVAWFPVLILCSILDKNPVAADDIQRKLNKLVDLVCTSLLDPATRAAYISSFSDLPQAEQMEYWVEKITAKAPFIRGDYFCGFGGQARTRFHYGAAHAILVDIEKAYIAEHGRNWLKNVKEARAALVLGQVDHDFVWFDGRQLWQVCASIVLVVGTSLGAFILSFFTPTVGLGCRTGGYSIFVVVALSLLIMELLVWWFTSPVRAAKQDQFRKHLHECTSAQLEADSKIRIAQRMRLPGLADSKAAVARLLKYTEGIVIWSVLLCIRMAPLRKTVKATKREAAESLIRNHFSTLRVLTTRGWLQRGFFTPLEFANMVWLCYLLFAQTIGAFNNCACMASTWGGIGGYLDFTQFEQADGSEVKKYWFVGTILTCVIMVLGMAYIVVQVCCPFRISFLSRFRVVYLLPHDFPCHA